MKIFGYKINNEQFNEFYMRFQTYKMNILNE